MKRWTPEEDRAWRKGRQERIRELHRRIELAKAELAAKRKPAEQS